MEHPLAYIEKHIRDIPDFPRPGIVFKDITPVLQDAQAFKYCIQLFAEQLEGTKIDQIVAIESRGFIFGSALAYVLDIGMSIMRKPGKLPGETVQETYELEYGSDSLEIHADAISAGQHCLIIDDLLATGGTAAAACNLITRMNAKAVKCLFLIELKELQGAQKIPCPCQSLLAY